MGKRNSRKVAWAKRKARVRSKVAGTSERPRLTIYRSLNHMYAQVIDDTKGVTLASASSRSGAVAGEKGHKGNAATAAKVGQAIADAAKTAGVTKVVFDRNGFLYHGRVKALADAARKAGLEF